MKQNYQKTFKLTINDLSLHFKIFQQSYTKTE